ncbi:MAG: TPM domain-containing protein [Alloprevotella sp.]|nr:TPM domain-containing protein [Alloprevotella sp.]
MKKTFLLLLLLLPLRMAADTWSPENLKMVHLEDSTRFVCNPDGILDDNVVGMIDSICGAMKQEKGIQTVVVCVEHLEGDDPYTFNKGLFDKYGIGQKGADNGLVVTLATLDRSYFISPGRGLEGTLPDALLKRIENAIMVPFLKEEEWGAALYTTMSSIKECIEGDETLLKQAEEAQKDEGDDGDIIAGLLLLFSVGGLIGGAYYSDYKDKHKVCPRCGTKHAFRVTSEKSTHQSPWIYYHQIWTCKKCGYQEPKTKKVNMAARAAGGASTGSILGSGGRSSSGGGFRGGSFGGGRYGGGGAGGRF